jgi:hypothetical protein
LELKATEAETATELDSGGIEYRRMYFMRRTNGTIIEFAEAIRLVDELPEFAEIDRKLDAQGRKVWRKAVAFFKRHEPYLELVRNDIGGHFGMKAALYALDNLTDFPAILEFWIDKRAYRADSRIDFAGELTAIAMKRHKLSDESKTHYGRLFTRVRLSIAHAIRCVHLLSWYYLQERFRS